MATVYWGQDEATWIGDAIPGPKTVFHFFSARIDHRRAHARCGAEMLTSTYPVSSLTDIIFDSRRWPICRVCAHAAGLAHFFGPASRAVMTPWPRLPKAVVLAAPGGELARGPVRLPNGTPGRPLRRVGETDEEWIVEFAPGVQIALPKAWLQATG